MSEQARRNRSARQEWAAPGSSHDRVVAILRTALPVGIGVLAAFLVMAPLTMRGDVSFLLDKNKVDVAKERLRLQSALYRGQDGNGRPFALTAGSAVQKSSAQPIVQINTLAAKIQLQDGAATLTAPRGAYDLNTEKVKLQGSPRFRAANGYQLDTDSATLDLKNSQMASDSPVSGRVPQGTFSANRMRADLETRTVSLDGNARLRIVPRGAK